MQPYQLKIRGKLEVLQLLEHDIVGTVAEGVGDYCNAKSLGHKLQAELLRLHHETDVILRNSGVPFTILQPNSFYQNMLRSVATIKAQDKFYLPLKNAPQSTVD